VPYQLAKWLNDNPSFGETFPRLQKTEAIGDDHAQATKADDL
jgi:hypothetical protein